MPPFLRRLISRRRVLRALRRWTPRDEQMLEFYSGFVSRGDLCFDVGANVGNRVKIFLRLGAKVVAIEPQAECAATLRAAFRGSGVTVIQKAMGAREGEAEMMISSTSTISSLSPEWIASVTGSGRFSGYRWDRRQAVEMATLDSLIDRFGVPAFIKIDVEGFELEVVRGLSRPVRVLSLEFTPEFLQSTKGCIDHLAGLGPIRLNYSLGESMKMELAGWVSPDEMVRILSGFEGDVRLFGDLYVRFEGAAG